MAGIWLYSEDSEIIEQLATVGRRIADQWQQELCAVTISEEAAPQLIAVGADTVIVLTAAGAVWPESYAPAIAELARKEEPSLILIGGTLRGKDVAAKVAADLRAGLVTDALNVEWVDGKIETERMIYGGLAICTEILQDGSVVTIPSRTYDPAPADPLRSGKIKKLTVTVADEVSVSNVCPLIRKSADLSTAQKIVCVGRGLGRQDNMRLAENLAKTLSAELGCTRSIAEDYHWLPNEAYIGLSGQKVRPDLYLSMGVSGQVQHVAGIRDSKIIVAIDTNENAPIFAAADYGIVGDLNEIVPLLTEKLK